MSEIVPIKGATQFTINLDPSVWIFDKRKIDLDLYIETGQEEQVPEREFSGSYAVPFAPFLENAQPSDQASRIVCHLKSGETVSVPLEEAKKAYLAFSHNGRPLKDDGPLHLYFGPGRHKEPPIKQIVQFEVKE